MFYSTWRITVLSHVVDRTCDIPELILRGYCVLNFRHWSEVVSTICFWFGNSDGLDLFKCEGVKSFRFNFLALKKSLSHSHSWMTPWAFCSLLHTFTRGCAFSASSWLETSSGSWECVGWAASTPCVRSTWINTRGTVLLGRCTFLGVCWMHVKNPVHLSQSQSSPSRHTHIVTVKWLFLKLRRTLT